MVGQSLSFSLSRARVPSSVHQLAGQEEKGEDGAKWKGKGPDGSKAQPRCLGLGGPRSAPVTSKAPPIFLFHPGGRSCWNETFDSSPAGATGRSANSRAPFSPRVPILVVERDTPCSRTFRRDEDWGKRLDERKDVVRWRDSVRSLHAFCASWLSDCIRKSSALKDPSAFEIFVSSGEDQMLGLELWEKQIFRYGFVILVAEEIE